MVENKINNQKTVVQKELWDKMDEGIEKVDFK